MKISTVLIVQNEEDRLGAALESCHEFCDDIVVVDGGSHDGTRPLARDLGARVFVRDFEDFSTQRNFALSKARYDWVFSIDADERVSTELMHAIKTLKEEGPGNVSAFRINRKTWFLGRFIRFSGWYPSRHIRLFNRHKCHWVGRIHEKVAVNGNVKDLKGHLLHYSYRSIGDYIAKMNRYSTIQGQDLALSSKKGLFVRALFSSPLIFLRQCIWRAGILDGGPGLVIAAISAWGAALKYLKAWEIRRNSNRTNARFTH